MAGWLLGTFGNMKSSDKLQEPEETVLSMLDSSLNTSYPGL